MFNDSDVIVYVMIDMVSFKLIVLSVVMVGVNGVKGTDV